MKLLMKRLLLSGMLDFIQLCLNCRDAAFPSEKATSEQNPAVGGRPSTLTGSVERERESDAEDGLGVRDIGTHADA